MARRGHTLLASLVCLAVWLQIPFREPGFVSGLSPASSSAARAPAVAMQSEKVDKIVDSLKELTLLEASELVKAIEETFDVDASASAGADAAPEKTVLKEALKEKKITVINAVRAITGLGLKDAKGLADNPGKAPSEAVQPAASTSKHRKKKEKKEAKKPVPKVDSSGPSVTKPGPMTEIELLEYINKMDWLPWEQQDQGSKLRASAPEFKYACDGSYGKQTSYNQMACGGAMACQGWNQQFNQWQSQAGWNGNDGQYDSYGNYVGPRTYGNDYNNCYYGNYGGNWNNYIMVVCPTEHDYEGNWQNAAWGSA
mmetsp:Transcript_40253/g.63185  ORF Transcript_40253/g.63185 Transcript_40253/m.63185 type:complete len:312 (-) Transcript_40253:54-989(-)